MVVDWNLSGLDQEKLWAVVKSVMKFRVEDSAVLDLWICVNR
jgi:hypothetical protein